MSDKIYLNGIFIKEVENKFGKQIRVSINVNQFVEELRKHANLKGYVNIDINQRKEADKFGNTHYAKLNTYEPKSETKEEPKQEYKQSQNNDGLPF
jgi:hypothetical protein